MRLRLFGSWSIFRFMWYLLSAFFGYWRRSLRRWSTFLLFQTQHAAYEFVRTPTSSQKRRGNYVIVEGVRWRVWCPSACFRSRWWRPVFLILAIRIIINRRRRTPPLHAGFQWMLLILSCRCCCDNTIRWIGITVCEDFPWRFWYVSDMNSPVGHSQKQTETKTQQQIVI